MPVASKAYIHKILYLNFFQNQKVSICEHPSQMSSSFENLHEWSFNVGDYSTIIL